MRTKKSALVVEDDPGIRNTLQLLLEAEGYTVFLAEHGRDGLDLLRRIEPPCVVLLDIQMPKMNGYEFLCEKNADPSIADVPVVVLSATADVRQIIGAVDFIRKPFEIPRLLEVVERHCGIGNGLG
jgi:CheY-like chemotaxis protein